MATMEEFKNILTQYGFVEERLRRIQAFYDRSPDGEYDTDISLLIDLLLAHVFED